MNTALKFRLVTWFLALFPTVSVAAQALGRAPAMGNFGSAPGVANLVGSRSGPEQTNTNLLKRLRKQYLQGVSEQCSLLGAPGLTTRSKDAARGSWHRY